jgi:Tol biopolymer transport system component
MLRLLRMPVVLSVVLAGVMVTAPAASADKILFLRPSKGGERMWVMRSDGSGKRRLPDIAARMPDLTLDGDRLAWTDFNDNSLWTGTITGKHRRVVWRGDPQGRYAPFEPEWSPSGRQIAAANGAPPPADWEDSDEFWQIFIVRPGHGSPRRLRTPVSMGHPSWSPDGRRIVATGSRSQTTCTGSGIGNDLACTTTFSTSLWVIDVASGEAREILHVDGTNADTTSEFVGYPAWSPTGATIAFGRTTGDRSAQTEIEQIWTIRPDGTASRQLTQMATGAEAPTWSPTGRRIAFTTRPAAGRSDVATMRADGSGVRVLTHGGISLKPDWSR